MDDRSMMIDVWMNEQTNFLPPKLVHGALHYLATIAFNCSEHLIAFMPSD
jgi:hypothetical protein